MLFVSNATLNVFPFHIKNNIWLPSTVSPPCVCQDRNVPSHKHAAVQVLRQKTMHWENPAILLPIADLGTPIKCIGHHLSNEKFFFVSKQCSDLPKRNCNHYTGLLIPDNVYNQVLSHQNILRVVMSKHSKSYIVRLELYVDFGLSVDSALFVSSRSSVYSKPSIDAGLQ